MAKTKEQKSSKDRSIMIDDSFDFSDKKKAFMLLFSRQNQDIRDSILNDLPAYNALLSMESESFEEIELRRLAESRGLSYNKNTPPVPDCPNCGAIESVNKKTGYQYRCTKCNTAFSVNYNSIISGLRSDALTVMKVFQCMLNFTSITRACEICDINKKTYYLIRNRIFYGLKLMMDQVKLYGEIQVDNTFVRVSYKGIDLSVEDVPEDSVFYDDTLKLRPGRKRGGSYSYEEKNANSICVFCAIDNHGHVLCRFTGIGAARFKALKNNIPTDKFLLAEPSIDPVQNFMKTKPEIRTVITDESSIMVADKEGAIRKYAESLGIRFEAHVYRDKNIQRKLIPDARNIQRVNALHKRLKDFLRKCNYVSTRYLPGYLLLFEYLEITGASKESVHHLFKILGTPNLGKPPSYYQDSFSVPNYLLEWLDDSNILKKLPYNKLLAYYLYDHIRNKEEYSETNISLQYICQETGYTAPTIRKNHKDLTKAGYREKILDYFGEPKKRKRTKQGSATFNPTVLAIYDEYSKVKLLPKRQRPTLEEFLDKKNTEYGTSFKRTNMLAKFKQIEESGIREPMPDFKEESYDERYLNIGRALKVLEEYEAIKLSYRERGEMPPKRHLIFEILGQKYGVSIGTIERDIYVARKHNRKKEDCTS